MGFGPRYKPRFQVRPSNLTKDDVLLDLGARFYADLGRFSRTGDISFARKTLEEIENHRVTNREKSAQ